MTLLLRVIWFPPSQNCVVNFPMKLLFISFCTVSSWRSAFVVSLSHQTLFTNFALWYIHVFVPLYNLFSSYFKKMSPMDGIILCIYLKWNGLLVWFGIVHINLLPIFHTLLTICVWIVKVKALCSPGGQCRNIYKLTWNEPHMRELWF